MTQQLTGKVALVTGASRGIGKGIALALGEAGATVYLTGRTEAEGQGAVALAGTIHQTAAEIRPGQGIAVPCDHREDGEVRALFDRIREERGRLDILVNNVWGGYEYFNDGTEFWTERGFWTTPLDRWDKMFASGVRAHYVATVLAAPLMIEQRSGLIVNISSEGADRDDSGTAYSAAKAATDRIAICAARELRPHDIAAISLYPGLVRTEAVLNAGDYFDLSNSESPQFVGRIIVALVADQQILDKSGKIWTTTQLANEYTLTEPSPQPA